ncbi:cupin-like domain-containing protein [Pseudoduganella lutea]|uniref:Cupin-like domain-containing protein n=1 Tax=Pseudoduganella lutea TaxID=321985 RepID=A0A4V0Z4F5_9BURK|nr:cupin-like domain-containing protein [Pseudoduganella lutea]QBE66763.1 cupin-like domain-containing protein [Pseudoduganella lutea]
MSSEEFKQGATQNRGQPDARGAARLPPTRQESEAAAADRAAHQEARERRDAQVRGVTSIAAMRDAIKATARSLPAITSVPRIGPLDPAAFRERASLGLPFLMTGIVDRWPLAALTVQTLRDHYSDLPVRARVGDYVNTAFAPDRAMRDMRLLEYLDLVAAGTPGLPPYLGNLEMRELNRLCHWPAFFDKIGPPRFWLGPAGTVTPLHCDYDDNVFAQIWGTKRIMLVPPHHDAWLYPNEANAILFGSPFDPEAPDYERFPLARQATVIECIVGPGDMLYVPAGWYHQVRSLTFSLSSNRWARAIPFSVRGDASLRAAPPVPL